MITTGYTALSKTHGVVIERSRLVFTLQGLTEGHTRALVSCGGSRDMNSYSPDYLCAPFSLCVLLRPEEENGFKAGSFSSKMNYLS